jgi:hypothetical protein
MCSVLNAVEQNAFKASWDLRVLDVWLISCRQKCSQMVLSVMCSFLVFEDFIQENQRTSKKTQEYLETPKKLLELLKST